MEILIFLGAAALLGAPFVLLVLFLSRKMNQASVTGAEMAQNGETLLRAFAGRVGARWDPPQRDVWGNTSSSKVVSRCHELDIELSVGATQGSSKNERVLLPVLLLYPPSGGTWRESPEAAITRALAAVGHSARRVEAGFLTTGRAENAYAVYLDSPEKRTGGNFVAPLIEVVLDVDTLVPMVEVICRAARNVVATSDTSS